MGEWRGTRGWATVGGEPEDRYIRGSLATCLWICTKAVTCNGQKNMDELQGQEDEFGGRSFQLVVQQSIAQQ